MAIVAGATRGAGRGIAVALGEAGATVYCSGRSTRGNPSPLHRPETIDETAALVTAAGGMGIAVRTDHTVRADVDALMARVRDEHGALDLLVNDVWGGDSAADVIWKPLAETDLDAGWALARQAIYSHLITAQAAIPLLRARRRTRTRSAIVEVTDGDTLSYRGAFWYDFIKVSIMRLAFSMSMELRKDRIACVAITPGFLRSEAMLELFGVTEATWRDGVKTDEHFIASETPALVGRSVAALAAEASLIDRSGETLSSWEVARDYMLTDRDGSRPDWLAHFRRHISGSHPAIDWMQRGLAWQESIKRRTTKFLAPRR
ncbi:MAG: SDR family NAD(P)-dependent oxidoreductase [Gemmatimonadaceae bacterium]|nr:SDR family NAD(P)-dependent oxidoreductase [Gemmatimonadaceae bacterium]